MLERGALGDTLDGRSREGRFLRAIEGGARRGRRASLTIEERLLLRRVAKMLLQAELLDEKLARGEFTPHDVRVYGALNNAIRLGLREIGLKAKAADKATPSLRDYIAAQSAAPASVQGRWTMTIHQAFQDPALFGPWFQGPSWNGWGAILKAAFGLPLTRGERMLFRAVAQRDPPVRGLKTDEVRSMALGIKTGGRKRGSLNKKTILRAQTAENSGLSPLEFLLSVVRDETIEIGVRLDAAKCGRRTFMPGSRLPRFKAARSTLRSLRKTLRFNPGLARLRLEGISLPIRSKGPGE